VAHLVGDPEARVRPSGRNEWALLQDCFTLLCLAKGNAPILVHKAQFAGAWNTFRYDVRFLVQFVGDQWGQILDWQAIGLAAPLEQLMAAPLLYLSGRGAVRFTAEEKARLKQYAEAGGVLLVEAAHGDGAFDAAFRHVMAELFPDEPLEPLPKDHPIYTAYFDILPGDRPDLEAIKGPCWVSVLYAPQGLGCPWDVADFRHVNFQLGTNIAAYVTGMQKLEGKLTEPTFHAATPEAEPTRARGAFTVGQIVHGADWRPHKRAWPRVLQEVNRKAGIRVYSRPVPIDLDSDSPFQAEMLYLTGVQKVRLSDADVAALRTYIERGGYVFAEAACGSPAFDRSFRKLVSRIMPGRELRELPVGHLLYEQGEALGEVVYSAAVRRASPQLDRPFLECMEYEGRAAIVYSKYDLSSAVEGHPCHTCPSVLEPSASRLLVKIVLYGLSG